MLGALQAIGVAATFGSTTSIIALAREMGAHYGRPLQLSIKTILIAMPDAFKFVFLSPHQYL